MLHLGFSYCLRSSLLFSPFSLESSAILSRLRCHLFKIYSNYFVRLFCHAMRCFVRLQLITLHQSTATSTWWCSPDPVWGESKWLLTFPRVTTTPGTPKSNYFLPWYFLNDCGRAALSHSKFGRLSLLPLPCAYSPFGERQRPSQPWPCLCPVCTDIVT